MHNTIRYTEAHLKRLLTIARSAAPLPAPKNTGADLSQWCGPVFDQAQQGSCTGCTVRDDILWLENRYGWKIIIDPSVEGIYDFGRKIYGDFTQDNGATVHDSMQGTIQFGVIPTSKFIYSNGNLFKEPPIQDVAFKATSQSDYTATTSAIRALLESGTPAGIAVDVQASIFTPTLYDGMHIVDTGVSQPGEGHAILCVAYKPDPQYQFLYKFQNSWGISYGDAGFAWFTERYLDACLREVCSMDIPQDAPSPTPPPAPNPQPPAPKPAPHPGPVAHEYRLTVGPVDETVMAKIETFCTQLHVPVIKRVVK